MNDVGSATQVRSILERIAAGESDAVEECLDRYGGLVWTLARRWSPNDAEAEDATQEVFLALWRNAGRFDENRSSEKTFVSMIARRRLIDRLRQAKRRPRLQALPEDGADPSGDQHERIEVSAEAARAAEVLATLKDDQRRVIELSIYFGMSHSEIAEATSLPIGTVKSHIFRGLAAVRQSLAGGKGGLS